MGVETIMACRVFSRFRNICLLAMSAALLAGCQHDAGAALSFEDARIRMPIPGTDKSVGYFEVRNNTAAPMVLVGARSQAARAIEFHTMIRDGDMMRMRRLQEVTIAPGETVSFEPGGRHLMLFGVGELGDEVSLVFSTADGAEHEHSFATFSAAPG